MYNYYQSYDFNRNNQNNNFYPTNPQEFYPEAQDERFFFAPFLVGGLAGTALGYGLANNNQFNNQGQCCGQPMFFIPQQPIYQQPMFTQQPFTFTSTNSTNTNFYN
ncbi:MAG: hypothetical protein J6A17_01850 [Bacilli bacterium]|nr:hypothetical protein [Bacilli bacterium]